MFLAVKLSVLILTVVSEGHEVNHTKKIKHLNMKLKQNHQDEGYHPTSKQILSHCLEKISFRSKPYSNL